MQQSAALDCRLQLQQQLACAAARAVGHKAAGRGAGGLAWAHAPKAGRGGRLGFAQQRADRGTDVSLKER
eukprot:44467-Chlamydomonas_euryale.AAC.2